MNLQPKTLRPYVSLDLETTGLDTDRSKIIQASLVLDDGGPIESLKNCTFLVNWSKIDYSEPYALGMNGWIFKQLTGQEPTKYTVLTPEVAEVTIMKFIRAAALSAKNWDAQQGLKRVSDKVQLAGKNVANFDWKLLGSNFPLLKNYEFVDHRFLDVGAEYAPLFGTNPGLNTINKLIDYKEVTHDALEDALNVVAARRWIFDTAGTLGTTILGVK